MGSFLKELAEEGNVKFGFAKKLGINQIKLLEIEGGRNTVSMDIENGTFTPEKLLAMEEAIKSYLRQKDICRSCRGHLPPEAADHPGSEGIPQRKRRGDAAVTPGHFSPARGKAVTRNRISAKTTRKLLRLRTEYAKLVISPSGEGEPL